MKKYLLLLTAAFIFGAVKAQVKAPYMDNVSNNAIDSRNAIAPGIIPGVPMSYTDNGSSGEVTYSDATGTNIDFSWSISGGIIYWDVDVEAPSSDLLALHRLYIVDDGSLTNDPETIVDDDYEGDSWGSTSWTSSGSTSLGSAQRNLFFSFENMDDDHAGNNDYEVFTSTIHYNEPL